MLWLSVKEYEKSFALSFDSTPWSNIHLQLWKQGIKQTVLK